MAYSFKIDGKLGDKLDGSDVSDPDGELPVAASSTATRASSAVPAASPAMRACATIGLVHVLVS